MHASLRDNITDLANTV